jgi:ankyrin repeat protein
MIQEIILLLDRTQTPEECYNNLTLYLQNNNLGINDIIDNFTIFQWVAALDPALIHFFLEEHVIEINKKNAFGSSYFHLIEDIELAKELLRFPQLHVDLDLKDAHGNTPLCSALERKQFDIAELICQYPIDLSIRNEDGHTALDIAKKYNVPNIIATIENRMRDDEVDDQEINDGIISSIINFIKDSINYLYNLFSCNVDMYNTKKLDIFWDAENPTSSVVVSGDDVPQDTSVIAY